MIKYFLIDNNQYYIAKFLMKNRLYWTLKQQETVITSDLFL